MSELEIKELQKLTDRINEYKRLFNLVSESTELRISFIGYDINLRLDNNCILVRKSDVIDTIYSAISDTLDDLVEKRDQLILCTKETKSVYKPINILDKE